MLSNLHGVVRGKAITHSARNVKHSLGCWPFWWEPEGGIQLVNISVVQVTMAMHKLIPPFILYSYRVDFQLPDYCITSLNTTAFFVPNVKGYLWQPGFSRFRLVTH